MAYYSIEDTDFMEGHEFEYFCADILQKNGFTDAQVTKGSGDSGGDILASKPDVTGKITYVIQCKCYESKVGNKAIQEAYFAGTRYGRMIAVVLTNNYFTRQAIEDARQTGVRLWDRDVLDQLTCNAYPSELYERQQQDEVIIENVPQRVHFTSPTVVGTTSQNAPPTPKTKKWGWAFLVALLVSTLVFAVAIVSTHIPAKEVGAHTKLNLEGLTATESSSISDFLPSGLETMEMRSSVYDMMAQYIGGDINHETAKQRYYEIVGTTDPDILSIDNYPSLDGFDTYFRYYEPFSSFSNKENNTSYDLLCVLMNGLHFYITGELQDVY